MKDSYITLSKYKKKHKNKYYEKIYRLCKKQKTHQDIKEIFDIIKEKEVRELSTYITEMERKYKNKAYENALFSLSLVGFLFLSPILANHYGKKEEQYKDFNDRHISTYLYKNI
jgi:hypothetical protein